MYQSIDVYKRQVGMVAVHLYRPFSAKHFLAAVPKTAKSIAVLDRTKEPGANGEPLYLSLIHIFFAFEPEREISEAATVIPPGFITNSSVISLYTSFAII